MVGGDDGGRGCDVVGGGVSVGGEGVDETLGFGRLAVSKC